MLTIHGSSHQQTFFDSLIADALRSNALLSKVDAILTDIPTILDPLIARYQADRQAREVDTTNGRPTIPIVTILRALILRHLHRTCAYHEVEEHLRTDYAWKGFARLSLVDRVPDATTLQDWETFLGTETVRVVHDQIIDHLRTRPLLKGRRLTGRKLRTDTTVAPASTAYPTDANLLGTAVRVITRIVRKITRVTVLKTIFRDRMRSVRHHLHRLRRSLKARTDDAKTQARAVTGALRKITMSVINAAAGVAAEVSSSTDTAVTALVDHLAEALGTSHQLTAQTAIVLAGGNPLHRIVSFHQPWVRPIVKGKLGIPCEFGAKLEVTECERGIITDWQVHRGNPNDTTLLPAVIQRHRDRFGRNPEEVATDRGYWSEENERVLRTHGDGSTRIAHVSIPKRGKKTEERTAFEHTTTFRRLQRWRAGGEATISHLKRSFGMNRSRATTERGFTTGIGFGIIARNLVVVSRLARTG